MSYSTDDIIDAIIDYIIDTLMDVADLDDIAVFVRGILPPNMVPQNLYPFCEVFIAEETQDPTMPELSGGVFQQVYTGLLTFNELVTRTGGDWLDQYDERKARVRSYDDVRRYVQAAKQELEKCEHRSLGDLTLGSEVVYQFDITDPRIYGLDENQRVNSWENFGSLPFKVSTEREAR